MKVHVDAKVMHHYVPGYVFQQGPFIPAFRDLPNCDAEIQASFVHGILPGRHYLACVGDTFGDPKGGRYFATWLAQRINKRSPSTTPFYVYCDDAQADEYTGVVPAAERRHHDMPSVVIISFGSTITDVQAERARDVIARFQVPTILQCSGVSPLEIAIRIQKPCHFPFYLTGARTYEI